MMVAMSMPCGHRVVQVSQPVHSQMNRSSKIMSYCPSWTARMIMRRVHVRVAGHGTPGGALLALVALVGVLVAAGGDLPAERGARRAGGGHARLLGHCRPRHKAGGLDDLGHGDLPLDGHDVHAGDALDLAELLDHLDGDLLALGL